MWINENKMVEHNTKQEIKNFLNNVEINDNVYISYIKNNDKPTTGGILVKYDKQGKDKNSYFVLKSWKGNITWSVALKDIKSIFTRTIEKNTKKFSIFIDDEEYKKFKFFL